MTDNKRLYVIGGLVILAIAAWALASHLRATPVDPTVAQQFSWKITDKGFDPVATTTPINEVTLVVAGVEVPIGTYQGACNLIDNESVKLLSGEVSGVICTKTGIGQEIGVFADSADKLSLKQGKVQKDDNGTHRTDFVELKKL